MLTGPERESFEANKRRRVMQVLLKCARLVNERAIAQVNREAGRLVFRQALANLFPHIALEGTRLTELAKRVGVTKQAVSQLVAELEGEGVVELVPDPTDGRAKLVRFTPRGLQAIEQGMQVFGGIEAELETRIGPEKMHALHDSLLALLAELEKDVRPREE